MIRVAVADAELREYVLDCVRAMSELSLANDAGGADLTVTDSEGGGERQLRIVDELPNDGGDYLLMPFDGRGLIRAIWRALNR